MQSSLSVVEVKGFPEQPQAPYGVATIWIVCEKI